GPAPARGPWPPSPAPSQQRERSPPTPCVSSPTSLDCPKQVLIRLCRGGSAPSGGRHQKTSGFQPLAAEGRLRCRKNEAPAARGRTARPPLVTRPAGGPRHPPAHA